jgi:hypothetical protein
LNRHALVRLEQRKDYMLYIPLRVLETAHNVIRRADRLLRLLSEIILLENHVPDVLSSSPDTHIGR